MASESIRGQRLDFGRLKRWAGGMRRGDGELPSVCVRLKQEVECGAGGLGCSTPLILTLR